jgi:WS/DGAT/MGAT family acyltransferase
VSGERLSALDASFLAIEGPSAPMHVGWVIVFDPAENGSDPTFDEVFAYIAGRLGEAPRYRQRLAEVPLGIHAPIWIDDPDFDPAMHLLHAEGEDMVTLTDTVFSTPLARDRPLWEIWIADSLPDGGFALIGKAHHCMVDGMAMAQLANILLASKPDADSAESTEEAVEWSPARAPSGGERLVRGLLDRALDGANVALAPVRLATSPSRVWGLPRAAGRGARMLGHTLLPPAPSSPFNLPGSGERHHVRVQRSLADLRRLRRRFGVTPNDIVLATCAGALRRFMERHGQALQSLKVMVPADVRSHSDAADTGNRISFVFIELPCREPDPVARLESIHSQTAQRERDGEAKDLDFAFGAVALTPGPVQRVAAHAFAHPRLFNLTISTMPGPAAPRYLCGCELREAYMAVPLADRHALSIGVLIVAGRVCFAVYADAESLPDADELGADLDAALDELLAIED